MKTCTKCGVAKPLDAFHRRKRSADGRNSRCKACQNARRAAYYAANAEAEAARRRAYRQANPETIAERNRAYHAANREAAVERRRARYAANRETEVEQVRAYQAANPHIRWESLYRRRVRQFGFEPVVETFTRDDLIARYGDQCWHCGGDFDELDHYPIAVRDGGPHALDNVRPSCTPCNRGWKAGAA